MLVTFQVRPWVEFELLATTWSLVDTPGARTMLVGVAEKVGGSASIGPTSTWIASGLVSGPKEASKLGAIVSAVVSPGTTKMAD